ncbi:MAG: alpha/beta fold hydrolase [Myxococcales bacterium]
MTARFVAAGSRICSADRPARRLARSPPARLQCLSGRERKNPYITLPQAGLKGRLYSLTPAEANDPEVVDAYAKAAFEVEKKTATSPQLDMVTIMPMVNARLMPVPTLIIHGQYDDVADLDGLFPFFRQLPNPHKRYVVVPNAGHMMHLQKGHLVFQREVAGFFKSD